MNVIQDRFFHNHPSLQYELSLPARMSVNEFPRLTEVLLVVWCYSSYAFPCPKCTISLQFRPLLLVLLAVLSASISAHGKVIWPGLEPESLFKKGDAGCPTQKDGKFPQTVRVNISISNMNQDTKVTLDISKRSLAPWDYRYCVRPYGLEMHWVKSSAEAMPVSLV